MYLLAGLEIVFLCVTIQLYPGTSRALGAGIPINGQHVHMRTSHLRVRNVVVLGQKFCVRHVFSKRSQTHGGHDSSGLVDSPRGQDIPTLEARGQGVS